MNLTISDLTLLGANLALIVYLLYMYWNTRKIVVIGFIGNTKFISVIFIIFAVVPLLQNIDFLSLIRSTLIALVGIMYSMLKSGLAKEGFVIMGMFYPWRKIQEIQKEKTEKYRLGFYVRKFYRFIDFKIEDIEQVEEILEKYQRRPY